MYPQEVLIIKKINTLIQGALIFNQDIILCYILLNLKLMNKVHLLKMFRTMEYQK